MAKSKPQPQPLQAALRMLSLLEISIGPNNPRKHFDEQAMLELADSIKQFGILQPIVVRTTDADGYELVCGERRYRAARLAGLEEVPAIIRTLTDDEAFSLQITENLQRKDINPMEESDAFFQLTKRGKTSAAKIADMLGVGEKYVYDRLALQRCISDVQDMVRSGKLPLTHAKQFARLNLDDQQGLYETIADKKDGVQLSDVKRAIAQTFESNLSEAPFNIQNPSLYEKAGACTSCPKRSGCNQLLFDDVQSHDICFDKSCYEKKTELHIESVISQLKAEGKEVFKIESSYHSNAEDVLGHNEYGQLLSENPNYEDCNTYGVFVKVHSWEDQKAGDVIKIWLKRGYYDLRGLKCPLDEDKPQVPTGGQQPSASRMDHSEEFSKKTAARLLDKFKANAFLISNHLLLRDHIIKKFYNVSNYLLDFTFERLGWDIVSTEEGRTDYEATIAKVYDTTECGKGYFLDLALMLEELDRSWWDRSDVEDSKDYFAAIGIDLPALMDEYETQNNHKF